MKGAPSKFSKIFGSGPLGTVLSAVLFLAAFWINKKVNLPIVSNNESVLTAVFIVAVVLTVVIIIWGSKSLPPADRGNRLCTSGAFKYVRHPLYAAFLCVFNFGLAIYLNSWVFVVWAVLLHPVWHFAIRYEEKLMIDLFGEDYREYQQRTGRFVPRLTTRS